MAPTSTMAAVNASTAPVRFSFLGGAKSTATAWTRSCRDRDVTSLYRGEPVIPALLPDQADGGEVGLPGQITNGREWGCRKFRFEWEPFLGTLKASIDEGEAAAQRQRGLRAHGSIRCGAADELDESIDREHQLIELAVDIRGVSVKLKGSKESRTAIGHQRQSPFRR